MTMLAQIRMRCGFVPEPAAPFKRASVLAGAAMARLCGAEDGRRISGVVAVMPYYGGSPSLLGWMLSHYRALGVGFFVFLDCSTNAELTQQLAGAVDCAVWRSKAELAKTGNLHALNFLRHRYAEGKWCLSVEPFDILMFPHSETRHIRDRIDFVENEQRSTVHAIVVDAYAAGCAPSFHEDETLSPREALPYVDRLGYQTSALADHLVKPIIGGVQRRALYATKPDKAPALNRIPLVRMLPERYYVSSTAVLNLPELNAAHSDWHSSPTACLLRYALLCQESALKLAADIEVSQGDAGLGSLLTGSLLMTEMNLITSASAAWRSSEDLVECGLINNGQWF